MCFQRKSSKLAFRYHFLCLPLLLPWDFPMALAMAESLRTAQSGTASPGQQLFVVRGPGSLDRMWKSRLCGNSQSQEEGHRRRRQAPAGPVRILVRSKRGDHIQVLESLHSWLRLLFLPGLLWKAHIWFRSVSLHSVSAVSPWAQAGCSPSLPCISLLPRGDWAKSSNGPQGKQLWTRSHLETLE